MSQPKPKYRKVLKEHPGQTPTHLCRNSWHSIYAAAAAKLPQSCPILCDPRGQPTRLLCPWDSPGKNTGVGCHFLLQRMKVKSESEVTQSCPTQRPHGLEPTRLLHPWDFPGKSTGVGCHCLLRCNSYIGGIQFLFTKHSQ